jgi:deoxyribonuclease-4
LSNKIRFVGGHVSIAGNIANSIQNTLKIGGNCMQIFAGSPRLWFRKPFEENDVHKYLKGIKDNNLGPVFIHALYLVNLATQNPELFEKSISSLVMDLQNGARIGSSGVIIHIGSHLGIGFDSVKSQLVQLFKDF